MTFDALPAATTFPNTRLDIRTELNLSGTWTDISQYVMMRNPVTTGRGHPDESTTTAPSQLTFTINNRDGRFSSLNPTGPYYGSLGRNTPIRVSVPEGASYWRSETDQASYVSTPGSALFPNGAVDSEWQIDVTLDNWNSATQTLASWWQPTSNFRSWFIAVTETGYLQFAWTTDGATIQFAQSTLPVPLPPLLRQCLRVTFAHTTGVINFYTAPAGNLSTASWTQLGGSAGPGSATSLFNATVGTPLEVGWNSNDTDFSNPGIFGKVHAFRWLLGIAGSEKAGPDFTAQTAGATSFTDAEANTWTLNGTGEISSRKYRFHGEVAAWPQAWDVSGRDVSVTITAGGLLRRLGGVLQPLNSALYRANVRFTGALAPVAYWPCEDLTGATQIASALSGPPMFISGPLTLASDSGFAGSAPIPVLNGATLTGRVPAYSPGVINNNILRFLLHVPAGGDTNNAAVATITTQGTVATLTLTYTTGGFLNLTGYDNTGTQLFSTGNVAFAVNGQLLFCAISLQNLGASLTYRIQTLVPGASSGQDFNGSLGGSPAPGITTAVAINGGGKLTGTAIGHVSVQSAWDTLFDMAGPLTGWTIDATGKPETAGNRFKRLCAEEGIPFRGRGQLSATVPVGVQTQQTLTALLQECADADRGQWTEPRQVLGWGYRTRSSLGNQSPAVTLDYSLANISNLTPVEDDQSSQNDITVTNTDGSSSRQVLTSGPLSVLAPPSGIGRYDTSVSVNLASDTQLDSEANWILHVATVNESRYPDIEVNLARSQLAALYYALQDLDIGDRLVIVNQPAWLPPGQIDQLIQGATETAMFRTFTEAWACVPSSPYNVAITDDLVYGRADTDGSTLHANISSGATSMGVDTAAGFPLWTNAAGDFPFDVAMGGERITVTNITGTSNPQTFTITRSVNGVVKAHTAGEDIRLYFPVIVSL